MYITLQECQNLITITLQSNNALLLWVSSSRICCF